MNTADTRSPLSTKSIVALVLFVVLAAQTGCTRSKSDPLQHGWKMVGNELLPRAPILREAKKSTCIWRVSQMSGQVMVLREIKSYQPPQEIRVESPEGILIGTNYGEWGGTLTLSREKGTLPEKILDEAVLQILATRTGFLIVTGSRLGNKGTLWLYSGVIHQKSMLEKKADLHGYPVAVLTTTNGIWMVDGDSIYLLDDKFKVQNLIKMPWLDLHPNSLAEDKNGAIYIGMQALVVRLTPTKTGYMREWFAGEDCIR